MKLYNYPSDSAEKKVQSIIDRGLCYTDEDYKNVTNILEDVRKNGDKALIKYINKFDAPYLSIDSIKVSEKEFKEAEKKVDKNFLNALDRAVKQVKEFHTKHLENSWFSHQRNGVYLGQIVNPVDAAGIYAPGAKNGKTPLVSSVIMGGIPAKIAGVENISLMTPPTEQGMINPYILVATKKVGINTVYKAGSAWAISALTYGTETVKKVDVIVGPGNVFVSLAKKIVSGTVGIDMLAGPSEIMVIADAYANPEFIAADLLSQAEHDILASAVLVTTSKKLAEDSISNLQKQITKLERKEIAETSLKNYGAVIVTQDLSTAINLANRLAPEHLELLLKKPLEYINQIRNAGAVFIGDYTPEPIGDYMAGPNHILPTSGTSRFASALSVDVFTKKTSLLHYSKKAFEKEAKDIICLADIEGLRGHANAIKIRLK